MHAQILSSIRSGLSIRPARTISYGYVSGTPRRAIVVNMKYQCEEISAELILEMMPLFKAHHAEIAHYQDMPFEIDVNRIVAMGSAGQLFVFTARTESGELVGYNGLCLTTGFFNASSVQATQVALYMDPEYRNGLGAKFIDWCDNELASAGVEIVHHNVPLKRYFGQTLERLGYECVDHLYARRLDKVAVTNRAVH